MMKRWALAAAAATVVTVGAGSTAGAVPNKEPEIWNCGGQTTMIVTAGRNGWIGDTKYKAVRFTVAGTVDPVDGPPFQVNDVKEWGRGAGAGTVTCTMPINESGPEGTLVGTATVIAVPA